MKDKVVFDLIAKEAKRESNVIELIASENYVSSDVLVAQGSPLTNKYAEGYPGRRYYGGCAFIDEIENVAIERAKGIFGVKFVNVQPHSGSSANLSVYLSLLKVGDKILGMDLSSGGHLTHGSSVNFSGHLFKFFSYGVDRSTGYINYDDVQKIVNKVKPKMIVCGSSAYSRFIDFERFRTISDSVGAILMADISHISGLVVAGEHPSPVNFAHVVTTTTHKTLRGPRGAIIMTNDHDIFEKIQKGVFPLTQGGPLMHVIAAKAVAFYEASFPQFKIYQKNIIINAKALSSALIARGFDVLTNGTDNHMFVVNLIKKGITGKEFQDLLDSCFIAVSRSTIPNDPKPPYISSGIRIGTPAVTSRNMSEREMEQIADFISSIYLYRKDKQKLDSICKDVLTLTSKFPIPKSYV